MANAHPWWARQHAEKRQGGPFIRPAVGPLALLALLSCIALASLGGSSVPAAAAAAAKARDRDHDLLPDRWERRHGLSPRRRDTDGDGLSDGNEVLRCGTAPLRRDTDRDGRPDGYEALRSGTDPRRAGFRIRPCRPLAMRTPRHALWVDRGSVGGRCDDDRSAREVRKHKPWCSLERALEAARGGRTVLVRQGTYPRLEVKGRRRAYLRIRPFQGEAVELQGVDSRDSSFLQHGRYAGDAGYLRLEGLRITAPIELMYGTRHVQLVGNDISSWIYLRLTRDVLIERNHIHDMPRNIRAIGADGFAVNRHIAGIFHLTIKGNRIERATYDAIAVYGGAYRLLIQRNEIAHIVRAHGSNLHVDGIQTQGGRGMVIRDNFIHDVLQGMILHDRQRLEHLVVQNNVIVRTSGWALQLADAPGARVENNTIWDSGAGMSIFDKADVPPPVTSVTLKNNIINWLQIDHRKYIAAQDYNLIRRGRGRHGRHDISSRHGRLRRRLWPRFANRRKLDYRLARRSPGVAAGTGQSTPARDALGLPRSRAQDIGALRHAPR